jgi:amino acid permease
VFALLNRWIEPSRGKHGSLTTIFSVWNAMVGTGMLTIPWAYSNSGFVLGLCNYF